MTCNRENWTHYPNLTWARSTATIMTKAYGRKFRPVPCECGGIVLTDEEKRDGLDNKDFLG